MPSQVKQRRHANERRRSPSTRNQASSWQAAARNFLPTLRKPHEDPANFCGETLAWGVLDEGRDPARLRIDTSCSNSAKFDKHPANFGPIRAEFGQIWPHMAEIGANGAKLADVCQTRPSSDTISQHLADVYTSLSTSTAGFGQVRATWAQIRRIWGHIGPSLDQIGQTWANSAIHGQIGHGHVSSTRATQGWHVGGMWVTCERNDCKSGMFILLHAAAQGAPHKMSVKGDWLGFRVTSTGTSPEHGPQPKSAQQLVRRPSIDIRSNAPCGSRWGDTHTHTFAFLELAAPRQTTDGPAHETGLTARKIKNRQGAE